MDLTMHPVKIAHVRELSQRGGDDNPLKLPGIIISNTSTTSRLTFISDLIIWMLPASGYCVELLLIVTHRGSTPFRGNPTLVVLFLLLLFGFCCVA